MVGTEFVSILLVKVKWSWQITCFFQCSSPTAPSGCRCSAWTFTLSVRSIAFCSSAGKDALYIASTCVYNIETHTRILKKFVMHCCVSCSMAVNGTNSNFPTARIKYADKHRMHICYTIKVEDDFDCSLDVSFRIFSIFVVWNTILSYFKHKVQGKSILTLTMCQKCWIYTE